VHGPLRFPLPRSQPNNTCYPCRTTKYYQQFPHQHSIVMSSASPESPPPIKKPRGKPKFNKLQLKKKTPPSAAAAASQDVPDNSAPALPAEDDMLEFFNRSKESYVPQIKSPISKKRRSDDEGYESPPFKTQRTDGGSDSEEESGENRRQRAALLRQRFV